jgi:hypothetical protein
MLVEGLAPIAMFGRGEEAAMSAVPSRNTRVALVVLVLGTLAATSCERLMAKKIGQVLANMNTYRGHNVVVIGTVKERIDVPSVKCYILNDGTGSIGVVTKGRLPLVGEKVTTRGRVEPSFTIGARKLPVIIEFPRPTPTPRWNRDSGKRGPG